MIRIQRQRTKAWRMPEGALYVGRPTRWGNPYNVTANNSTAYAVERFRRDMERNRYRWSDRYLEAFMRPLRDATALACWCPLDQPCHADVLLELLAGVPA